MDFVLLIHCGISLQTKLVQNGSVLRLYSLIGDVVVLCDNISHN